MYIRVEQGGVIQNFFAIFEIGHIATDQIHFYEFNSKKLASLDAHARRTQEKVIFFNKCVFVPIFQISSLQFKEPSPKRTYEYKCLFLLLLKQTGERLEESSTPISTQSGVGACRPPILVSLPLAGVGLALLDQLVGKHSCRAPKMGKMGFYLKK